MKILNKILVIFIYMLVMACSSKQQNATQISPGAELLDEYLPLLDGKTVGFIGNQTSIVDKQHLVDVLLEKGVNLKFVVAPEHGFRGEEKGGKEIGIETDEKTGLPIYSLYKGSASRYDAKTDSIIGTADVILFDLQDVGTRFYTYSTSLHVAMQLCANHNKTLIVLDRPNPNGDQVDGPVRSSDDFKSDVSYHKIAMVHGLTMGELAVMINGENWLDNDKICELKVIKVNNYTHRSRYELPVKPSPNLPNHLSVRLYPSLCLFEATPMSVARGTDFPFQAVGYYDSSFGDFTFTPQVGAYSNMPPKPTQYYGVDLRHLNSDEQTFTLKYVLDFYHLSKAADVEFFSRSLRFDQLAGTGDLQEQIKSGMSEEQIRATWQDDLAQYKQMRKKYLLYEDFE